MFQIRDRVSASHKKTAWWEGPFLVLYVLGPVTYEVQCGPGKLSQRHLHLNHLKEWHFRETLEGRVVWVEESPAPLPTGALPWVETSLFLLAPLPRPSAVQGAERTAEKASTAVSLFLFYMFWLYAGTSSCNYYPSGAVGANSTLPVSLEVMENGRTRGLGYAPFRVY